MRTNRRTAAALVLAASTVTLVGCSSAPSQRHAGDIDAIRANPSPAMYSLGARKTDISNRRTITNDTNLRMLPDDWDRLWLQDRPTHLTMYPPTRR